MKRAAIILCMLTGLCLVQKAGALGDERPTLLIMPFDNATGDKTFDSLREGLPDLLTAFFSPYDEKLRVIDRRLLETVFAERGLKMEGFADQESNKSLGQLTQARYILRGSISGARAALEVNIFLYETETTRLVKSFEALGPYRSDHLTLLAQKMARMLAEFFQTPVKELPELPLEEDPQKSLNLIYGLGYFHQGQFEEAVVYFMKILEDHPEDELARYWLAKTFLSAGLKDHARLELENFLKNYPDSEWKDEIQDLRKSIEKKGSTGIVERRY